MAFLNSMGERIRASRQAFEWTLDDLSSRSGLSKGFLSDLENDKRDASVGTVKYLSDALQVSVEWLVRGVPVKPIKCPVCRGTGEIFKTEA